MSLTLVSAEGDYVVFEDADGDEIVGTPLPVVAPLVMWEDYDLLDAWRDAVRHHQDNPPMRYSYRPDRVKFVNEVRRQIADTNYMPEIVWCENCDDPTTDDVATPVNGGDYWACPTCFEDDYRSCDDCGNTVRYDDTVGTLHDELVCQRCSDRYYSYCEDCDGYYNDNYSDEHQHSGCDCSPPSLAVTMPNGDSTLSEDERLTVSLPAGVISDEGMFSISRLVREYSYTVYDQGEGGNRDEQMKWWNLSHAVTEMDNKWQTKDGNFTKRLSKLAHKAQGLKFPAELLTKVGNIARDNSQGSEINIEITRNLNLPAEDFYHEDSCWWQSYSESRCSLKNNGGIGLRTFEPNTWGDRVSGRAWIMPLRADEDGNLSPTFDAQGADAYVVFNGYGDLSGYTPARVVAGMVGMTYKKINFDCSPMYVNGNSGYLVASEEIASKYDGGSLDLNADIHSNLYYQEQRETVAA